MLGRDEVAQVVGVEAAVVGTDVLLRDQQVDAEGPALGLGGDPVEVDLELAGAVGDGAEHPHAPGVGDGGDDVAAVAEGQDRELDAESLGDGGAHRVTVGGTRAGCRPQPLASGPCRKR